MHCLRISELEKLASALVRGTTRELYLTPKPGLVDRADSGSHPDLSLPIMEQSIGYVADYLDEIVVSLKREEPFSCQKQIAIRAEQRLYDNLGTNTHKGYIFLSGMLLIARWHAPSGEEGELRKTLSSISESFFRTSEAQNTNGQQARRRYNTGGIVREAIDGYPTLFEEALPAFRMARLQGRCEVTASFAMMARLMQTVDDTTTLHRGGLAGLEEIRRDGLALERMISGGGDHQAFLEELNRAYVDRNLTMGGVADMLGIAFGYLIANGEIGAGDEESIRIGL